MAAAQQMTIVVVGAGIAGISAVRAIRAANHEARVVLINGESRLPYKRTQLSKHLHSGFARDEFALEPAGWYQEHGIELVNGVQAVALDPSARTVSLVDGTVISWQRLILATGALPRWPEGVPRELPGVHAVREADSAEALLRDLAGCRSVLIVGMGVLGVEIAEQARRLGRETTMVDPAATAMAGHLTRHAAERLQGLLETNGVHLFHSKTVNAIAPVAEGLRVSWNGGECTTDRVVACVGTEPNTALAAAAGLAVGHGIQVDGHLRTSSPDIFATGDCAELPGGTGCHLWHCAEAMGRAAGLNAAGDPMPYHIKPFRLKCEVFGDYFFSMNHPGHDQLSALHVEERAAGTIYQCFFFRVGRLDGVVMAGDRDRARRYEEAVWSRWPREQVLRTLTL